MNTMISMLHSPTKTFEYIRERGGCFTIPFITIIVIALISILLQVPTMERAFDTQEIDLAGSGLSEETFKQLIVYGAVAMAPVMIAVRVFFLGLVLLLLNLVVRGEASYMQLVKVAVFSFIPGMFSSLITGIMLRMSDADSPTDVLFSLGVLFEEKQGFLFSLANMVNPFSIWSLAILIIGVAVMCRRPLKTVGIWIVGIWLVVQLFSALLAQLVQLAQ